MTKYRVHLHNWFRIGFDYEIAYKLNIEYYHIGFITITKHRYINKV